MFLFIKQPGLIFRFRNKEYRSPVEFPFRIENMQNLLVQLKSQGISNFFISPTSKKEKTIHKNTKKKIIDQVVKSESVEKPEKIIIEKVINSDSNDAILKVLHKMSSKIDQLENKISTTQHTIIKEVSQPNLKNTVNRKVNNEEMFIPDIEIGDMGIKSNIKTEKSEDNSDSVDALRRLLGGN